MKFDPERMKDNYIVLTIIDLIKQLHYLIYRNLLKIWPWKTTQGLRFYIEQPSDESSKVTWKKDECSDLWSCVTSSRKSSPATKMPCGRGRGRCLTRSCLFQGMICLWRHLTRGVSLMSSLSLSQNKIF